MLLVRPLRSCLLSWRVTEGRGRLLAPAGADVGGQVPVLVEVGVEGQRSKLVIGNQVASVVGHLWVSHVRVSEMRLLVHDATMRLLLRSDWDLVASSRVLGCSIVGSTGRSSRPCRLLLVLVDLLELGRRHDCAWKLGGAGSASTPRMAAGLGASAAATRQLIGLGLALPGCLVTQDDLASEFGTHSPLRLPRSDLVLVDDLDLVEAASAVLAARELFLQVGLVVQAARALEAAMRLVLLLLCVCLVHRARACPLLWPDQGVPLGLALCHRLYLVEVDGLVEALVVKCWSVACSDIQLAYDRASR